jgi:hypothetical protein
MSVNCKKLHRAKAGIGAPQLLLLLKKKIHNKDSKTQLLVEIVTDVQGE